MSKESIEKVADNVVVSMHYTLTVDGEIFDSSEGEEPIVFIQGFGNIITGLEKALYGLKVGDKKKVHVTPEEGYGEIDPEAIQKVPRDEFPSDIPLEKGVNLEMKDEDGEIFSAVIVEVYPDNIKLDFNDPLAGKNLEFDVEIVELRQASEEELDHGHVHLSDFDDDEDDFEFEDFDDDDEEYDDDEDFEDED